MVVFTCNHCGDSLQKPKVEKHYSFVCRTKKSLTCVDCLKDFIGEEYNGHIKCMTEDERYAAKGTFKNGDVKKGELKQEQWSDTIRAILNDGSNFKPSCKNLLSHIVNFSNVPRKKPKFVNFMKSTMGGRIDHGTIEEVWDIIEEYKNKVITAPIASKNGHEFVVDQDSSKRKNEDEEQTEIKTKKKKTAIHEEIALSSEEPTISEGSSEKLDMKKEILQILDKKKSITLIKLEKKILKMYSTQEEDINLEKFKKRFNKKLKKIPNIVIEDERVSIKK